MHRRFSKMMTNMQRSSSKSSKRGDIVEDIIGYGGFLQGWLLKRGESVVTSAILNEFTWKRRWFQQQGHKLFYYKDQSSLKAKGFIDLVAVLDVKRSTSLPNAFEILTQDRTYILESEDPTDRDKWIPALLERCPKLSVLAAANPRAGASSLIDARRQTEEYSKEIFSISSSSIKILEEVGKSSFGSIYRGIANGKFCAIRSLDPSLGADEADKFVRDAQVSFSLRHHNILRVYGMCIEVSRYSLVTELCPRGSLHQELRISAEKMQPNLPIFDDFTLFKLALGIAKGMLYLYDLAAPITYGELRSQNIQLGVKNFPKVCVFGFKGDQNIDKTQLESIAWSSPEALAGNISEDSDIWSFGCVLVEMMTGRTPFWSKQNVSIDYIASGIRSEALSPLCDLDWLAKTYEMIIPPWLRELAGICFNPIPSRRPRFKTIVTFLESLNPQTMERYRNESEAAQDLEAQELDFKTLLNDPWDPLSGDIGGEVFQQKANLSSLQIQGELASGQFGTVYIAKLDDGEIVAVKRCQRTAAVQLRLHREFEIMAALPPHPNIVRLYGLLTQGETMSIVMEFVPCGTLMSFVEHFRKLYGNIPADILWKLASDIACGMQVLARHNIVHRDLSARNVLLDADSTAKITDFGLSVALKADQNAAQSQTIAGPVRWSSPEQLSNGHSSEKSDVWSYGCTLYEICTGTFPFPEMTLLDVIKHVRDLKWHPLTRRPDAVPAWLRPLVTRCFSYNPGDRPSFLEIIKTLKEIKPTE